MICGIVTTPYGRRAEFPMAPNEFQFHAHDFDECRLVHSILPRSVHDSELSVVAWQFLELYETPLEIAVVSDYTAAGKLTDTALAVVGALIDTSFANSRFVAAVWVVGGNVAVGEQLKGLLVSRRLDPGLVVETYGEALSMLRGFGAKIPEGFELGEWE